MSSSTLVPGVKSASVIAAGVLLTMSVGSASAATPPVATDVIDAGVPTSTVVPIREGLFEAIPVQRPAAVAHTTSTAVVTPAVALAPKAVFTSGVAAISAARSAKTPTAQAAMFTAYTQFTTQSPATKDMRGVQSSLYRGKFYRPAVESRRLCIVERESEGHYDVVNPTGSYRGAYQVSSTLARGATWMMLKEHKALMGTANATRVLTQLRKTPINKWPRYWQDALFSTVANWDYTGSGIRHWAGGRWHC